MFLLVEVCNIIKSAQKEAVKLREYQLSNIDKRKSKKVNIDV